MEFVKDERQLGYHLINDLFNFIHIFTQYFKRLLSNNCKATMKLI